MLGDCLGVVYFNNPAQRVQGTLEFIEACPFNCVGQGRGGRVGGLWAAVGPGGAGTGSGMEERVGLSKAVGRHLLSCSLTRQRRSVLRDS